MEMRAYLSDYVPYAQRILGDMLDFAVNTCDMDIDEYFELFTVSSVSTQCSKRNYYKETNLKRLRKLAGLSQRELSDLSGVPLRQIQLLNSASATSTTRKPLMS